MAPPLGSFATHLPFWTTLPLSTRLGAREGQRVGMLVLKDGTLAVGMRIAGLELEGAQDGDLNRHAEVIAQALATLPADAYLQCIFESGDDFEDLCADFSARSDAVSHPVLRRGRQARAELLRQDPYLTRCRVTYWLGWRQALSRSPGAGSRGWGGAFRALVGKLAGPGTRGLTVDAAAVTAAGNMLLDAGERVRDVLRGIGIEATYLGEPDVLADLHRAINPTRHRSLPPPAYMETDQDLELYRSGEPLIGRGPTLAAQLPLGTLSHNDTQLAMGEPPILQRAMGIAGGLGMTTHPRLLHRVLFEHLPLRPMRLVVTHVASDRVARARWLSSRRRLAQSAVGGNLVDYEARQALEELERLSEAQAERNLRIFDTSVTVVVSGESPQELDQASRSVAEGFAKVNVACSTVVGLQLREWLGALPANGHRAPCTTTLTENSCAHLTPYWLPTTGDAEPDILFETRQRGLFALSVRPGAVRDDTGSLLVGKTGGGKTFFFSMIAKHGVLDLGGHVIIADVKGHKNSSYRPLCDLLGGSYLCLDGDADASFNPFAPAEEMWGEDGALDEVLLENVAQVLVMMAFKGDENHEEADYWTSVGRDVVRLAYELGRENRRPIILEDAVRAFASYRPRNDKLALHAQEMRQRLEFWCDDPRRRRLFNRPQRVDTSNRFCVFDFHNLDRDPKLSDVLISVLATRIEAKMSSLPKTTPKLFAFDEAWSMFEHSPQACALLARLYRVSRSYGAFCYVLTQTLQDVLGSRAKDGIMPNSSMIYLMRHSRGGHLNETASHLRMTPEQTRLFESVTMRPNAYAEIMLLDRNFGRSHVLQYVPTPFDLWSDTSRPVEVERRAQEAARGGRSLDEVIQALARQYPAGIPPGGTPAGRGTAA